MSIIAFFIWFFFASLQSQSAIIIVHGTWAQSESWYQKNGDFFLEIERSRQELHVADKTISFSWSGKLDCSAQIEAAMQLAALIEKYEWVIIIAHSHGATVGIIASNILGQKNTGSKIFPKIEKFYALAIPVQTAAIVQPNMHVIKKFYNLFSFADFIQTGLGVYGRIFNHIKHLINASISIDGLLPSHSGMRSPIIARDLLKISEFYSNKNISNFNQMNNMQHCSIDFLSHQHPVCDQINDIEKLVYLDRLNQQMINFNMFRKAK